MSRQVLIVENGRDRGAPIARMVEAAGLEVRFSRPYRGEALGHPRSARSTIILTGGPGSVCDRKHPDSAFLSRVVEFAQTAIDQGRPIIGICLGHQIIARALSGQVARRASMEVGIRRIHPVTSSVAVKSIKDVELKAFVFHQDHVPEAPPGCAVTFRSKSCAVAGFSHRERPVHGLQFHPEIDDQEAKAIIEWWYSDSTIPETVLAEVKAFDAKPARRLLLSLIQQYAAKAEV